jgi:hypothetical protein
MSTRSDGKLRGVQKSIPVCGVSDSHNVEIAKPDKPLTAAQRRGLARKITAYLKRSGLDCELVGERRKPARMLN